MMDIEKLCCFVVLGLTIGLTEIYGVQSDVSLSRKSFPHGFVFGTATSAYQYEGAVKEDGRGPSIWDTYSHQPGHIVDFSNGDVAVDEYHRYEEDIGLMAEMGMDAYRFSISWSRIYPNGSGNVNQAGVDYYNRFINALLAKGIEPYVTLYHWDLPQALDDAYKGWLSTNIIKDYVNYAETCFAQFGDRVKHWLTFNEPHNFAFTGYDLGLAAPGRCSIVFFHHSLCKAGNSSTEPYIVAHNVLLSHTEAVQTYRKRYKKTQGGSIGIAFDVIWYEPFSNSTNDIKAAQLAQDFQLGWFLDPIFFGDYPASMRERVGERLPRFSESQSRLLKGSLDFVGVNHYTTLYALNVTSNILRGILNDSLTDSGVIPFPIKNGVAIGEKAASLWLYIVPWGIRKVMNHIKQRYNNPPVVITENGMDDPNDPFIPLTVALKDDKRIKYHQDYLSNLSAAIQEDGCNVKGYFAWSLLDNWEWTSGFTVRFGLHFVDYNDNLKRYPKASAEWFKRFLQP